VVLRATRRNVVPQVVNLVQARTYRGNHGLHVIEVFSDTLHGRVHRVAKLSLGSRITADGLAQSLHHRLQGVEQVHVSRAGAIDRTDLETVTHGGFAFDLNADTTGQLDTLTLVLIQYALADNCAIHFNVVLGFRGKANGVVGLCPCQRGVAIGRTDYCRARI